jgi:uncharacterized protein (TIGR02145 family)
MKRLSILFILLELIFTSCEKNNKVVHLETFTDSRDGQEYEWVEIGDQIWMAEYLNYATIEGSYLRLDEKYGRYYIWDTACNACPIGWHLPSNSEWQELVDYLGKESGMKMMSESWCTYIGAPLGLGGSTVCGTNESGLNVLPGGYCWPDPERIKLSHKDHFAFFWLSTEKNDSIAYYWSVSSFGTSAEIDDQYKRVLCTVRCVKD